jgi:hypothetical protein
VFLSDPSASRSDSLPAIGASEPVAQIRTEALRQLLVYWYDKRGGRTLPALSDIDPTDIPTVLGQIWLCDRLADSFRYRLAGEKINAFWGHSIAGKHLDEIVPPARLASATKKLRMACELPAIIHESVCLSLTEEIARNGERMILPLSDDGVSVNVLLGAAHGNWGRDLEFDPYVSCTETTTVTAL